MKLNKCGQSHSGHKVSSNPIKHIKKTEYSAAITTTTDGRLNSTGEQFEKNFLLLDFYAD